MPIDALIRFGSVWCGVSNHLSSEVGVVLSSVGRPMCSNERPRLTFLPTLEC